MKLVFCKDWEELKSKNWINPDYIISVMETPKNEIFIKLIDGRQIPYFGTMEELKRELYEKWNQKNF